MQNTRHAEQVVGQVVLEVFNAGAAGALAISCNVRFEIRNAEFFQIQSGQSAERTRRYMPSHAVVSEIGQWVTECGEFPIEDREYFGLGGVENKIIEPVVAVDDTRFFSGRYMLR